MQQSLDSLDVLQARHSGMTWEQGLRVRLLMCPRRIEQTQFWTISALRIFAAAEPPSGLPSSAQHLRLFKYSVLRFQEPSHSYESHIPMISFFAHWTSDVHDLCVWQLLLCESKWTFSMCVFQCLDCRELLYWFNWGPMRAYFAMNSVIQWDCFQSKHRTVFGIQAAAWTFSN